MNIGTRGEKFKLMSNMTVKLLSEQYLSMNLIDHFINSAPILYIAVFVSFKAVHLECDITQYSTHSIAGLPSADGDGWYTVRGAQSRIGKIRCVNSTWQTTCDAGSDFSSCCFNESSPGFQTPPGI